MRRITCFILGLLMFTTTAAADWYIQFESKEVTAGQQNATIELSAAWEVKLMTLEVPIVVRSLDPGAFWTGTLPYDSTGLNDDFGVTWNWADPDWADLFQTVFPGEGCATPGELYDGNSPDNFDIAAVAMLSRAKPQPDGRTVLTLHFAVTETPGQFEFDTACFQPASTTYRMFTDPSIDRGPLGTGECSFTKGVITIVPCECSMRGDTDANGLVDPSDIVTLVNYLFYGGPAPVTDLDCPTYGQADTNCDGRTNVADIAALIRYIFRDITATLCNPCAEGTP